MLSYRNTEPKNLTDVLVNIPNSLSPVQQKLRQLEDRPANIVALTRAFHSADHAAQDVVHDLNNLLMVIGGFADIAYRDPDISPRSRAALENIIAANGEATTLARQVLSETGRAFKKKEECNVADALGEIVRMTSPLLGPDVCLQTTVSDSGLLVACDVAQFSRAITNLILNARDALPLGGVIQIIADTQMLGSGRRKEYVRLRVQDNGIGMDATTQARIFEPFFSTKGAKKGSGVGLHMVNGFISDCGGYVSLESEKGHGSTFTVHLPIRQVEPEKLAARANQ